MQHHFAWLKRLFLFLLISVISFLCGWLYIRVYRTTNEPDTRLTYTSRSPIYFGLSHTKLILKNYPDIFPIEILEQLGQEPNFGTYIIPGLRATKTIHKESRQIDMCTSMTPQGLAVTKDYVLISAYCHTHVHKSVIYMIDKHKRSFIKEVILPNQTHAGGLAYDPETQLLWVSDYIGQPHANAYLISRMEQYHLDEEKRPLYYDRWEPLEGLERNSFMTYYEDHLYAGYFALSGNSIINKYSIDAENFLSYVPDEEEAPDENEAENEAETEDETETKNEDETMENPLNNVAWTQSWSDFLPQVQGMAICDDTLLISQSYGYSSSKLHVYELPESEDPDYRLDTKHRIRSYTLPNRMEQICVSDGKLYLLFESGAYAYRGFPYDIIDRVITVDLSAIGITSDPQK